MSSITKLAQYDNNKGLQQKEAISNANRMGACILANKEFDQRLVLSDTWKGEKEVYPAWVGTLVAFKEKNAKLGDVVKYTVSNSGTTYIFEVPKEYQNEKNAILVVNHGFLADGKALIIPSEKGSTITYDITDKSQIALLQNFPTSDGWYNAGNKFGIPIGEQISPGNTDARYLYKVQNYVGLLARGSGLNYVLRRDVYAGYRPSYRFGVLIAEEPAGSSTSRTSAEVQDRTDDAKVATPNIKIATANDMKELVAKAKQEVAKFGGDVLASTKALIERIESQL